MYPEFMIAPMREELTRVGVRELRTADDVDEAVTKTPGTTMVVVNSVCGCAAGKARPGVALALQHSVKPDHVARPASVPRIPCFSGWTVRDGNDALTFQCCVPTPRQTKKLKRTRIDRPRRRLPNIRLSTRTQAHSRSFAISTPCENGKS